MCLIYSEGSETINARKILAAALGQLQLEIPRPNYETWLKPTSPSSLEHDILTICGIDPANVSDEDIDKLNKLGFFVGEEYGDPQFHSFKFGSA